MNLKMHTIATSVLWMLLLSFLNPVNAEIKQKTSSSPTDKKKILFLAGHPSHGNGEHEHRAGCLLLAEKLNNSGLPIEAKVHYYGWPKDETIFNDVNACIIYADAGGRFDEKYAFLNKKVKQDGMGIMFIHYGVHPPKKIGETYFKNWIGAYMSDEKSVNPHWIADVSAIPTEEVARGIKNFAAYDEFYFNMQWPTKKECACCRPLAVATPSPEKIVRYINMWNKKGENCFGKEQALMWCRDPKPSEGGRGVGFVGGHYHRNWAIDDFRKLVLNAIVWTARGKVPKNGVPAGTVTAADINKNLDRPDPKKPLELPTKKLLTQKPAIQPHFTNTGKRLNGVAAEQARAEKKVKKEAEKEKTIPRQFTQSKKLLAANSVRHQTLTAKVEGLKSISLEFDALGDKSSDWIAWTDLSFTLKDGSKLPIKKQHILANTQGWRYLQIDKNLNGKPIQISGKSHAKGFAGHAPSSIILKVPKNAVSITATAGLEDDGAIRNGKPSTASVQAAIINPNAPWQPKEKAKKVALDYFSIPKDSDLEVTLWANSPMLFNPTNMDIDHAGRIWIAEGVNYRSRAHRRGKGDRIMVLQDTNGDGRADSSHVFYQDPSLECPLGVSVIDNKIYVPQPPHLMVYTDVDRNLKFDPAIDKKQKLLTGFNAGQHDHSLHSVTAGPEGKLYFNNGNCGAIFRDRSGKLFNMNGVYRGGGGRYFVDQHKLGGKKSDDGFLWTSGFAVRMNPDGTNAEIVAHGFRNSYEQSVNSAGDIFQNDNDDFSACRNSYVLEYGSAGFFTRDGQQTWRSIARPGEPTQSAHWRQRDPGTFDVGDVYGLGSPTGNVFYENGALGNHWQGTYLASEPGRNTIFGYKPKAKGAGFSMNRFDFATTNKEKKFVGGDFTKRLNSMSHAESDAVLFRPSDIAIGADGALYVADWYDGRVGGHATLDDSCSGAIYRIAPKNFKPNNPKIDTTTINGLLTALKSPAINVRHLGFIGLKKQGAAAYPEVVKLLNHENKWIAFRAIYLLPHLGEQGFKTAEALLQHSNAETRLVAFRALKRSGKAKKQILHYANQLANDPDTHIGRDVALSLRHFNAAETAQIFTTLSKKIDPNDKNSVEAIGLGAENKENAIWQALHTAHGTPAPLDWSPLFAKLTWRLWSEASIPALQTRASSQKLTAAQREQAIETIAFIESPKAAKAMLELAQKPLSKEKATYWLLKRGTGSWSSFGIRKQLKELGIYDPDKIVVIPVTVPAEPKEKTLQSVAEILKLKGDANKGKQTILRCAMCHEVNGIGAKYGPALKGWGSTQTRKVIVRSILEPSADIAHGFKGKEITLKDGGKLHGLVIPGDPAIVISTGGIQQLVPAKKIKSSKWMTRSLMLSAQQLGLTAQDIADIASYMQEWK